MCPFASANIRRCQSLRASFCGAVLVVAVGHANQTTQPSADLSNHFTGNSDPCLCHPLHQCSHTLNLLPAEPC